MKRLIAIFVLALATTASAQPRPFVSIWHRQSYDQGYDQRNVVHLYAVGDGWGAAGVTMDDMWPPYWSYPWPATGDTFDVESTRLTGSIDASFVVAGVSYSQQYIEEQGVFAPPHYNLAYTSTPPFLATNFVGPAQADAYDNGSSVEITCLTRPENGTLTVCRVQVWAYYFGPQTYLGTTYLFDDWLMARESAFLFWRFADASAPAGATHVDVVVRITDPSGTNVYRSQSTGLKPIN